MGFEVRGEEESDFVLHVFGFAEVEVIKVGVVFEAEGGEVVVGVEAFVDLEAALGDGYFYFAGVFFVLVIIKSDEEDDGGEEGEGAVPDGPPKEDDGEGDGDDIPEVAFVELDVFGSTPTENEVFGEGVVFFWGGWGFGFGFGFVCFFGGLLG